MCEHFVIQAKQAVDKTKNQMMAENESLAADLKDTTVLYQETDKRRKAAEAALSEAQSRIGEDTSRIQELTSQNDKMKVLVDVGMKLPCMYL